MLMQKLLWMCFVFIKCDGVLRRPLNSNNGSCCIASAAVELLILLHGSAVELSDVKLCLKQQA